MNTDTLNLIARPYAEVVDDLLTAIVGGVVNEPIIFDVKVLVYSLAEPAADVRGITGTIRRKESSEDEHFTFQKTIDFEFDQGKNAVVWLNGGTLPKDDTTFFVDYFRLQTRSPLTDINIGSVTRTLSEAIGREIATVYQQINLAYLSGFIDTAQGKSLDFVVAILDVFRKTKDFAVGFVTFFRDPAIDGNITIPQEASLATTQGEVTFHTTEPRTLQRGQARIDVPIRADSAFGGEKGIVKSGAITSLALRIAGIARITNFEPTSLAAQDETDEQLRLRAKAALRALGKATLAALAKAISDNRARLDEVSDPNTLNGKASTPGTVTLLVQTETGRFPSLQAAVNETRAAGVLTTLVARFVFFTPHISAKITPNLTGAGKDKIKNDMIAALESYVEALQPSASVSGADMLKALSEVKDISSVKFIDVRAWRADIGQPGSDPLVEALVASLQGVNAQDTDALRAAISDVIAAEAPALLPSGRRIPDRTLIVGVGDDGKPTSEPVSDGQIESSKFQIVPPAQFSVVIDMEAADIALQDS